MARIGRVPWSREPSIWDQYMTPEGTFPAKTAWEAPTYESWWPFPFPAPEMPGGPSPISRLTDPEGAKRTLSDIGGRGMPDFEAGGFGGTEALPAIASAVAAGAGMTEAERRRRAEEEIPQVPSFTDFGGGAPSPSGPPSSGAPSPSSGINVGALLPGSTQGVLHTGGATTAGGPAAEAISESMGTALGAADIYGQSGELLTSGAYSPSLEAMAPGAAGAAGMTAAELAAAEAGLGIMGPGAAGTAPGAFAGLGGGAVSILPTLLAGLTNLLGDPGRGFFGIGANPTRNFHKTQMLHDIAEGASHSTFAQTLPRTGSLADIANVFNQIAGGSASVPGGSLEPAELRDPAVLDKMFTGSLFQGDTVYNFLKQLQKVDPSNPYFGIHPMRATPAPVGEPSGYTPGMSKSDIARRLGRPETQEEEDRRTMGHGWAPWNP